METRILNSETISQPCQHGCEDLITISLQILNQLKSGLLLLTQDQYAGSPGGKVSSIGSHTRHIVEFYQALMNVWGKQEKSVLCYDNRQRNMILETSKEAVLQEVKIVKASLKSLPVEDMDIQLASIIDPNKSMLSIKTTLHRELFYLLDHTVHHMALIKMLAEKQDIVFDRSFGLAQSTQAHENTKG